MINQKILQLIPTHGWLATFKDHETDELFCDRVAMWALVENGDGSREVVGLCANDFINSAEDCRTFTGYVHESGFGTLPTEFTTQAT